MILGDFGLLWLVVWIPLLLYFGLQGAGRNVRKPEPDLHGSVFHWNNNLVHSPDKHNVVDFVFVYYDNTYYVCIKNDRLGLTKEYKDKDKYMIQREVQRQFEEWAAM